MEKVHMTTGSTTTGSWQPVTTSAGPGFVGHKAVRVWSGADRPARERLPYSTSDQFYYEPAERWVKVSLAGRSFRRLESYRRLRYRKIQGAQPKWPKDDDHPYTLTASKSQDYIGSFTSNSYPYSGTLTQANWGGGAIQSGNSWGANDDLTLIERLRAKVNGSEFNAGIFFAELPKALQMISHSAIRLASYLRRLRRGDLRGALKALTEDPRVDWQHSNFKLHAANFHLEVMYGWLPLVEDMVAGAEFLAHLLEVPPEKRYRARYTRTSHNDRFPYRCDPDITVRRGQVTAIVQDRNVAMLSGMVDLHSVLWEATPYSFLADIAIPIGSYLSARGLSQGLQARYVRTITTTTVAGRLSVDPSYANPDDLVLDVNGAFSKVQMDRTVLESLEVPLPTFKPVGQMASWRRAANAVALLTQSLSKG
jgi:hypothetical protein